MDLNNQNVSIFACQFSVFVEKAKVQIKFPCSYFLQWKASNGKIIVSSKNRYQANKSEIIFNESLSINVNILFDKVNRKYLKKQSLLMINLISKSRPDQIKLVGRVIIDLAQVLNSESFNQMKTEQLEYCSVDATVNFHVKSVSVKQSTMNVSQLDRSSFNEYMSFQTHLKPYQQLVHRNEGSVTHRDFDEVGSVRGSDKGEIRSLGRDKSKMSSSSLHKQGFTPVNRAIMRNESTLSQHRNKSNNSSRILNEIQNNKILSPKSQEPAITEQLNNFSFNNNLQEETKPKIAATPFLQTEIKSNQVIKAQEIKKQQKEPQIESKSNQIHLAFQKQKYQHSFKNKEHSVNFQILETKSKISQVQIHKLPQKNLSKYNFSGQNEQQTSLKKQFPASINLQNLQNSIFPSIPRERQTKKLSLQMERSHTESKRIIGLTDALNQLQIKYTKMTLQTQELRSNWRKQKQQLLETITKQNISINIKDKEIILKYKQIQNLQKNSLQLENFITELENNNKRLQRNNTQLEKSCNQKLSEFITLKAQLVESQKGSQNLLFENSKIQEKMIKLQNELKMFNQKSSFNEDQLHKVYNEKNAAFQQKIQQLQNTIKVSQKQVKMLKEELDEVKSQNDLIKTEVKFLQQQNKNLLSQNKHQIAQISDFKSRNEALKSQLIHKQQQINNHKNQIQTIINQQKVGKQQQINGQKQKIKKNQNKKQQQLISTYQNITPTHQIKHKNQQIQQNIVQKLQQQVRSLQQQIGRFEQQIGKLQQQIEWIKKQTQQKIINITSETQQQIQKIKLVQEELNIKNQHLQNTLMDLNDQISQQQTKISSQKTQIFHYQSQISEQKTQISTFLSKISHFQSKIFDFQSEISKLNKQLSIKDKKLYEITQNHEQISQKQIQKLGDHQELLLSLNTQIQDRQKKISQLQQTIKTIENKFQQKDIELLRCHQENEGVRRELQILKAQSTIYQSKLQQMHYTYQKQLENNKISFNQKMYSLQIRLQQQMEKVQQMERMNTMLKQALQEWQNKCTDDKISSSKKITALNDIIKEKQSTMYEMENIMRILQKDKISIEEQLISKNAQFHIKIENYKQIHQRLKKQIQVQQTQLLNLYELVKKERKDLKQILGQKQQIISQMNEDAQKSIIRIDQMNEYIIGLQKQIENNKLILEQINGNNERQFESLRVKNNNQFELLKAQHNQQVESLKVQNNKIVQSSKIQNIKIVQSLKVEHNQEIDEYEERIRELENIVSLKENQIIDKEMLFVQQQKQKDYLIQQKDSLFINIDSIKTLLSQKDIEIQKILQSEQSLMTEVQRLKQQHENMIKQQQHSLIIIKQKTQLQNTLISLKNIINQLTSKLNSQQSQFQTQISTFNLKINQLNQQNQSKIINLQQQYNLKIQSTIQNHQNNHQIQIKNIKTQNQKLIQQTINKQKLTQQQQKQQITQLQELIITLNLQISQKQQKITQKQAKITQKDEEITIKNGEIQNLKQQHSKMQSQLNSLKNDRQTFMISNFKQQTQKLKQQIFTLTQQNLTLKNQNKQIPQLERSLKIKTIQNNSLKFKSNNQNPTQSNQKITQSSHFQDIIKLKDQQIQTLQKQNQKIPDLQLQLYQVQTLNQGLYQDIQQYEEEKFHLNSGMNQKDIKIAEFQQEIHSLSTSKNQLKQKNYQLTDKLKYYENLILDYKGNQISSTKSQSENLNQSQGSSKKLIQSSGETQTQNLQMFQIQTFAKKIKILESQIQKQKIKEEQFIIKNQQNQTKIKQYEQKITGYEKTLSEKDLQINKKLKQKSSMTPPKTIVQYRNPQQVASTFKELQNILKKRSQFFNLESSLMKLFDQNRQKNENPSQQKEKGTQQKVINLDLNNVVLELSKEFQNLKAKIMKLQGKNYQQKAKMISLLRPIEEGIKEAVKFSH